MPNRDHDDAPYNRNEGRFESPRYDRDDYRDQSNRGSREWDRSSDFRAGERNRGSSYANYNPSRDDNGYRGGSRFEEPSRNEYGGSRSFQGYRSSDDDGRWRDQESLRNGQFGGAQGGYRSDWRGSGDYDAGNDWGHDLHSRDPYRGNFGGQRQQPSYGPGSQSNYGGSSYGGNQRVYGGAQDWNRDYYARDHQRSSFDPRGRNDYGRNEQGHEGRRDDNDWGDQMRHAGQQMLGRIKRAFRGPKGYKRSDDRIREDVNDRLAQQDEFDPSDIEVRVENGEVTLTGTVRSRHEKFRAEEIADDVSGVNEVQNQLRVGSPSQQQSGSTSASTGGSSATTGSTGSTQTTRNGRA
jgi:osmotically-inducible protein OsmY